MMTALLSVGAWAENLWNGSETLNYGNFITLPTATHSISMGGILTFTISSTSGEYPTLKLNKISGYWVADELVAVNVSEGTISRIVNETIATAAVEDIAVYGGTFTITSVDYEKPARYNVFTNSSGESVTYNDHELSKDKLAGVQKGDMLEINITGTAEDWGANLWIYSPAQWQGGTKLLETTVSGGASTKKIVLTDELVSAAHTNGLFLNGGNYTYTSVDIVYAPTVNISSAGYATLGFDESLDLTGIDAYTVTVNGDKAQLTSIKGKKIPAGTGIILEGSGNVTIPLTTEDSDEIETNDLKVSDGTVTGNGSTIYVLANGDNGVGFYLLESGDKLAAGKAYLVVSGGVAQVRQFIGFGDNATGIDNIEHSTPHIEQYYDLQGRRVAQPTKGLYVVNGKKVIIK